MAKPDAVFIYIGTYPDEAAARNDYDVVKDDAGKVHVNKDEMATRHDYGLLEQGRRRCPHISSRLRRRTRLAKSRQHLVRDRANRRSR
jgi:hypothetical protein